MTGAGRGREQGGGGYIVSELTMHRRQIQDFSAVVVYDDDVVVFCVICGVRRGVQCNLIPFTVSSIYNYSEHPNRIVPF